MGEWCMKVLIVGAGGREHALAWKFSQSSALDRLFTAPGNAGIAQLSDCVAISPTDIDALRRFVLAENIDLVVPGPEASLVEGLANILLEDGVLVFGPTKEAARLEGSKSFAKHIMDTYGIPTGMSRAFTTFDEAKAYVMALEPPIVVKADGLCGGKGVTVAGSVEDAIGALHASLVERVFGDAGATVLVEEFLEGPEVSIFVVTDGQDIIPVGSAQDYKRAYDDDAGPNTGGMGSYAPAPFIDDKDLDDILDLVFVRTVEGMAREGVPYSGVLYGGFVMTETGPKVLEFNCRFGDPETQAILPLLDGDLLAALAACAAGDVSKAARLSISDERCTTVVLASGGYPGDYSTGFPIEGLTEAAEIPGVMVFHAGTAGGDGQIVTNGGRVLNVSALGDTFAETRERAYEAVSLVNFETMHYRTDIAKGAEVYDG